VAASWRAWRVPSVAPAGDVAPHPLRVGTEQGTEPADDVDLVGLGVVAAVSGCQGSPMLLSSCPVRIPNNAAVPIVYRASVTPPVHTATASATARQPGALQSGR
jgi:hypothetical protein